MASPSMHSVYGRALGVSYDGYPTGQFGWKDNVVTATSATTGTALQNYGVNVITVTTGSTATTFSLPAPVPGVNVTIINGATASTQSFSVKTAAGTYKVGVSANPVVTAGSSYNNVAITRPGAVVDLIGISTSYYAVIGLIGFSTADTPFTVV